VRTAIRQEIVLIDPLDGPKQDAKADVLSWIDSGAELCRREKPATPPKHLISYVAVIDHEHVLLVDHINAGLWLPPGGHVEPDEHPRDTVHRECLEELGFAPRRPSDGPLFLTVTDTVGITAGHTDVSLWYVVRRDRYRPLQYDASEFSSIRWFHKDDVPLDRADPQMSRFLQKLYGGPKELEGTCQD
jgi:8-oxo-dGTP diphosphatase